MPISLSAVHSDRVVQEHNERERNSSESKKAMVKLKANNGEVNSAALKANASICALLLFQGLFQPRMN